MNKNRHGRPPPTKVEIRTYPNLKIYSLGGLFMKIISRENTRVINGGAAITFLGVCEGLGIAYGIYEGGKFFVNVGIGLGNKIFKNNAKYI